MIYKRLSNQSIYKELDLERSNQNIYKEMDLERT
jgi:hypothetical protein